MAVFLQRSAFLEAIQKHNPSSTAVVNHDNGTSFSYGTLLHDVACAKEQLVRSHSKNDLAGDRVAFMVENGYEFSGMNMPLVARLYCIVLTLLADSHLAFYICMQRYRCTSGPVVPNRRAEAHHQQQQGNCSAIE
jgi:acyl-CoA synthetase (AMP-forming)/AMP-acid ligase II